MNLPYNAVVVKAGDVVGVKAVNTDNEIMMITTEGIVIRLMVNDISVLGRITSGVKLMAIDQETDIKVARFTKVRESDAATEDQLIKELEKELDEEDVVIDPSQLPDEIYSDEDVSLEKLLERANAEEPTESSEE